MFVDNANLQINFNIQNSFAKFVLSTNINDMQTADIGLFLFIYIIIFALSFIWLIELDENPIKAFFWPLVLIKYLLIALYEILTEWK